MLRSKVGGIPQLTTKERVFANEYIKTKNATKSAIVAYNVKKRENAGVVGGVTMNRPIVRDYIQQALKDANYNPVTSINSLKAIEEEGRKATPRVTDSLNASAQLLKLATTTMKRSTEVSLSLSLDTLDTSDLLTIKQKFDKFLDN